MTKLRRFHSSIVHNIKRLCTSKATITPVLTEKCCAPGGHYSQAVVTPAGAQMVSQSSMTFIQSFEDLNKLHDERDSIVIIEPHEHVGKNQAHEPVRASLNIVQFLKTVNQTSHIIPLWENNGFMYYTKLDEKLRTSKALIFEGGACTIYDKSSFAETFYPDAYIDFVKRQLLSQEDISKIFICVSHQACAVALVRIAKDLIDLQYISAIEDPQLKPLQDLLRTLFKDAEKVGVRKNHQVYRFWDKRFAVAANEAKESSMTTLVPYVYPKKTHLKKYKNSHDQIAEYDAILEGRHLVAMFHGDEVNEDAMLFVNYCFSKLAELLDKEPMIMKIMKNIEELEWVLRIPIGVEIVASTCVTQDVKTESACMHIYCRVEDSDRIRVHYSTQFHPELFITGNGKFEAPNPDDDLKQECQKEESGFMLLMNMINKPYAQKRQHCREDLNAMSLA